MRPRPALGTMVMVGLAVGFGALAPACRGGAAPPPSTASPTAALPRCEPEFQPPPPFTARSTFAVRESDHVGRRVTYVDPSGRKLVFASGITGEFGEGEPVSGTLSITTGEHARLLGRGSTWTLVWSGDAPCVTRAVIGNGIGRSGFERILQRAGVVAPAS